MTRPTVVIVGATGAVGEDLRRLVAERDLPVGEVRLVASARSAGRRLPVLGEQVEVQALAPEVFDRLFAYVVTSYPCHKAGIQAKS